MKNTNPDTKESLRSRLAPVTYYAELAKQGMLFSFLQAYLENLFTTDERFRKEMYTLILQNSPDIVPEIEELLMGECFNSLQYFLDHTATWRQQEDSAPI